MIKKIFLLILLLVLIINCSNLEFVYNSSYNSKVKEKTLLSISGDNKNIINSYLLNKLGEVKGNPTHILSIVSKSTIEAVVMETDATASKFMIEHDFKYILKNIGNNCIIVEKSILTTYIYETKSAGYSFGTDLAEKELSKKNIHSNIDQFIDELFINYSDLKCKNES